MEIFDTYVLDANVLITAHRQYYAFDLVPAFWPQLVKLAENSRICSIKKVQDELLAGPKNNPNGPPDLLSIWAKNEFAPYFRKYDFDDVRNKYAEIIEIVNQLNYQLHHVASFAKGADGWLIAFAFVNDYKLVTLEKDLDTKKKVSIPKICDIVGVKYLNTFEMLRKLSVIIA